MKTRTLKRHVEFMNAQFVNAHPPISTIKTSRQISSQTEKRNQKRIVSVITADLKRQVFKNLLNQFMTKKKSFLNLFVNRIPFFLKKLTM